MAHIEQPEPLARALDQSYRHGFVTDVESDSLPPGLDEETIREISRKKREPEFLLRWRLAAYQRWLAMSPPDWDTLLPAPLKFAVATLPLSICSSSRRASSIE